MESKNDEAYGDRDKARRNTRARFEQWARNPACEANVFSAVHNVPMADVASSEGFEPSIGQSPFALARGDAFERSLFFNNADRLIDDLVRRGVLAAGASGLLDLRIGMNGGPLASLEDSISATLDFLSDLADSTSDDSPPAIVAGATVRIPKGVMLPEAILIIDVLAVAARSHPGAPHLLHVGEVKTYPDRGGFTDKKDLAGARGQAGVYLHALDIAIASMNIGEKVVAAREGFLVLTKPGSNFPSVRVSEDLRYQAERARRGFELLESAARRLPPFDRLSDDPLEAVTEASTAYTEICLTFCDRAMRCHAAAVAAHDPAILGDDAVRFLGGVDLRRASDLLAGQDPVTDAERDLVRRIAESDWTASLGYS